MARAWIPRDVSGCVLWVRADLGITLASGKVSRWADQSGSGNDLTQGTSANQPTPTTNAINGCPSVTFADSSGTNLASAASALAPSSVTMVVVMRRTASQSVMFVGGRGDTGFGGYWIGTEGTSTLQADFGNGSASVLPSAGAGSWGASTWMIASGVYDGSNGTIYKNGGSGTSASLSGALNYAGNPTFYLGNTTGLVAGRGLTGDIAECVVFNRALGSVELKRVHQYMSDRYAIAIT